MTDTLPLLIELGTEELPPKALDELAHAFRDGFVAALAKRGVTVDANAVRALWTPRRLALLATAVPTRSSDQQAERRGPALSAGLDANGAPTKALQGFAQSCGVDVAALEKLETDKGAWFVHRATRPGEPIEALVPAAVDEALKALPIPKPMRWGDRETQFVRPVHWLVMLLGDRIIEGEILGLRSGRTTRGHRFHAPGGLELRRAGDYVEALRGAKVLVDPVERRQRIADAVEAEAARAGGAAHARDALLDEVKNLVEWPVAIACAFEAEFLRVPPEALMTTMEANQKFFPVLDGEGRLSERFIGVANLESRDPAQIRQGYERVIRPRFADAAFFFDEDLKAPLASHQEALAKVTYQKDLGSTWDKCLRVAELARTVANRVGVDAGAATQAAALSKCDLMTRMVGEFPELQGVMGRHYAAAQGLPHGIALAIDDYYEPRSAGDAIAEEPLTRVLAVADKLDTLAGMFAVAGKPSGSKDPFSLRRNALGLARTLIEGGLDLDLRALLADAFDRVDADVQRVAASRPAAAGKDAKPKAVVPVSARIDELHEFIVERLRGYYAEQGVPTSAFDAVATLSPSNLLDFDRRLRAVVEFAALPEAESLAAANKRIGNLLRQAREKGDSPHAQPDPGSLEAGAESALAAAIESERTQVRALAGERRYVEALKRLAVLRGPVDAYFDGVMVMVDDAAVRANRLALLERLRAMFLEIADVSYLAR